MIPEYPRNQGQLLFAADGAHHRTGLAVELGRPQKIGVGVTDLRDTGAPRVDLGEQGSPPQGVIHHLSLQSHVDQSTSTPTAPTLDVRRGTAAGHAENGQDLLWPAPEPRELLRS